MARNEINLQGMTTDEKERYMNARDITIERRTGGGYLAMYMAGDFSQCHVVYSDPDNKEMHTRETAIEFVFQYLYL